MRGREIIKSRLLAQHGAQCGAQSHDPDWVICFFLSVEFEKFFIDLGYQPFICSVICKDLPFRGLPLSFVGCFLSCAEAFNLDKVPIVLFF